MNKKTFISTTALVAVAGAVAGAVYYRHIVLEQLDEWLHDAAPIYNKPTLRDIRLAHGFLHSEDQDPEDITLEEADSISGRLLHQRHPDRFDERGRPIRHPKEENDG